MDSPRAVRKRRHPEPRPAERAVLHAHITRVLVVADLCSGVPAVQRIRWTAGCMPHNRLLGNSLAAHNHTLGVHHTVAGVAWSWTAHTVPDAVLTQRWSSPTGRHGLPSHVLWAIACRGKDMCKHVRSLWIDITDAGRGFASDATAVAAYHFHNS